MCDLVAAPLLGRDERNTHRAVSLVEMCKQLLQSRIIDVCDGRALYSEYNIVTFIDCAFIPA